MRGWGMAVTRRVVGVGRGRPMAGGCWPGGQASPPTSLSIVPTAQAESIGGNHAQTHTRLGVWVTVAAVNLS